MKSKTLEQTINDMQDYIRRDVAAGFSNSDEICDSAVEIFSDEQASSKLLPHAKKFVQEAIEAHIKEQANWEKITDCDRLDQAFEDLESQGIISRQNFSCCGTCGAAEILDEIKIAESEGKIARGYTFYHFQDTEHAVEGQGLYLSYGSTHNNYFAQVLAGYKIAKTIKRHGLVTKWNGNLGRRIFIQLEWKRRR